jgi:lysozyme family protein
MQEAAGLHGAEVDGAVGKQTLDAVGAGTPAKLIDEIAASRMKFYDDIVARDPSQTRFLDGWKNRVKMTQARANSMARLWV